MLSCKLRRQFGDQLCGNAPALGEGSRSNGDDLGLIRRNLGMEKADDVEVFAEIRKRKDNF